MNLFYSESDKINHENSNKSRKEISIWWWWWYGPTLINALEISHGVGGGSHNNSSFFPFACENMWQISYLTIKSRDNNHLRSRKPIAFIEKQTQKPKPKTNGIEERRKKKKEKKHRTIIYGLDDPCRSSVGPLSHQRRPLTTIERLKQRLIESQAQSSSEEGWSDWLIGSLLRNALHKRKRWKLRNRKLKIGGEEEVEMVFTLEENDGRWCVEQDMRRQKQTKKILKQLERAEHAPLNWRILL